MLRSTIRKLNNLASDPILRRWLFGQLIGKWRGHPLVRANPSYFKNLKINPSAKITTNFPKLPDVEPKSPIKLILPGEFIELAPGDETEFVERKYTDTESLLALHRFAWINFSDSVDIVPWTKVIFNTWLTKFGADYDGWAWHPYTASERLINLINFFKQHGLPEPRERTVDFLTRHGPAIIDNLEYFGESQTGNHLANNGRGLFLGGLALGLDDWAEIGGQILIAEGERIFTPRGMLREGSSHYHLLVTRWYLECWLAALEFNRPEIDPLEQIAGRALSAASIFDLPGGFPLIGDVSPDCPPEFLSGLIRLSNSGWLDTLDKENRSKLNTLRGKSTSLELESLVEDGWLRRNIGPWSILWYFSPEGWSFLPGHGHRDFGGFELHYDDASLLSDLGRRSYGPSGEIDISAGMHNTLLVDGAEPYPPNKPYYSDEFKELITGAAPSVSVAENSVVFTSDSFSRLNGVGQWQREWNITGDNIFLVDKIDGRGSHKIDRILHTTLPVEQNSTGIQVGPVNISFNGNAEISSTQRWRSYGQGEPATSITISNSVNLPWTSTINLAKADG